MQNRKETAWKKNRKFGDIKGGRLRTKLADNIFQRYHSLDRPSGDEQLPIYFKDNPSRDFYHPIDINEIEEQLSKITAKYQQNITHIWLRKVKKSEYDIGKTFQGCYINGRGVHLIVINAFPRDLKMRFGKNKPEQKNINSYSKWTNKIECDDKGWYLVWTEETIKDYYLNHLFMHEIGHYIDSETAQYYSKANTIKKENFAENFARVWYNESSKNGFEQSPISRND